MEKVRERTREARFAEIERNAGVQMNKYGYEGEEKFRPISPWGYFGYSLLFCIPLIGLILLIVFSFNNENINRRNFARYHFCIILIFIAVFVVFLLIGGAAFLSGLGDAALSGMLGA